MWIGDYSYYPINAEYLPIAVLSAMQYGQALDHLIREVGSSIRHIPGTFVPPQCGCKK